MEQPDIKQINHAGLIDIFNIPIDTSLAPEQRMRKFMEQVKNPYVFLCGDTAVRIRFEPMGDELTNKLKNYFVSIKKS